MENLFGKIAQRYAASLFDAAHESNVVREIWAQLEDMSSLLKENRDYRTFVSNPLIPQKEKQAVNTAILKKAEVHDVFIRFMNVLIENNRTGLVKKILYFYRQRAQESFRMVTAHVQSVIPLSDTAKKSISAHLKSLFHNDVELVCSVAPEILGGLVIRVNNQVMDFSLKNELTRIKEALKQEG
ncbi:ATP synthase F1 subunit delta [bacterium]|nr:ATP synthase F1 subunit delta [bacterium]MCP5463031.1 ATP synthase F1 subunit delta [bacterium]